MLKNNNKQKRHLNKHHCIPRSRGGHLGKTTLIPIEFHRAWHIVFENLYGDERIKFIEELNRAIDIKNEVTGKDIEGLRERIVAFRFFPQRLTKGGEKDEVCILQKPYGKKRQD